MIMPHIRTPIWVGICCAIALFAATVSRAQIVYVKDYDAQVRFLPPTVQLVCMQELRPADASVPVDVVEIPESLLPRSPADYEAIVGEMVEVGERIDGTWEAPELFEEISEATPDIIHSLRRFYGGNMEVNYRFERDPNAAASLAQQGFQKMTTSRRVPAGAAPEDQYVINLWVRSHGDEIRSYGTATAMLTLVSSGQEVNKREYKYRANFAADGAPDFDISDVPGDPRARQRSQEMYNEFRLKVLRNAENIQRWLNRPRTLLAADEIEKVAGMPEGEQTAFRTEINFRWCGEPKGVRGVVDVTAGRLRVANGPGERPLAPEILTPDNN